MENTTNQEVINEENIVEAEKVQPEERRIKPRIFWKIF